MHYGKAIVGILGAALSAILVALTGDNTIGGTEAVNIAIAVVGAFAVFTAPNVPGAAVTKAVIAVLMAVLTLTVDLIADGITISEWLQLAAAAVTALGVYLTPNRTTVIGRHA